MRTAKRIRVRGVVQGVGFRPFVYRIAHAHGLAGWVTNDGAGVDILVEGAAAGIANFLRDLAGDPPPASRIEQMETEDASPEHLAAFEIRASAAAHRPTVHVSPDLPVCESCLREMRDPGDRRFGYPYINCTDCGPRYSIILGLPYDRPVTTMAGWDMCDACHREYVDPLDRRFHAQPIACPACGPAYRLADGHGRTMPRYPGPGLAVGPAAVDRAVAVLLGGGIVAVKGLGGYHLACDARNVSAVTALRERKVRREKPFAVMVPDAHAASRLVDLSEASEDLLTSIQRPIVLAAARVDLPGVAPENVELGVMLPYTPLHHLLFDRGAPRVLVMTSANRSSEPIAYTDADALDRLAGVADAFMIGERPIARRVDDSVARCAPRGPTVLRRSRGFAPGSVAGLPAAGPVVAMGADLKNTVALAVQGRLFVSQHIGDLAHYGATVAFRETLEDLLDMYGLTWGDVVVAHDAHPGYRSTQHALERAVAERVAVQHHRAHVAAVLAEREAWDRSVLGVAFDGTGYGDDGAVWGGELFVGSVRGGFERVGHLRYAQLPGGDAAARFPVQAAAGFLSELNADTDFSAAPFGFPARYGEALALAEHGVRSFPTTSVGRLFDTVAALAGFVRKISFEGQAAIWLEHMARRSAGVSPYPMLFENGELDYRPMLDAVVADRTRGRDPREIARAFHEGLASGTAAAVSELCDAHGLDVVVLCGGVFQNALLVERVAALVERSKIQAWIPRSVPPNDGGISVGQATLAAFGTGGWVT